MPTGHLMWDDFDPGSGKTSEHIVRPISWENTAELIKICQAWVKEDGSVPYTWQEEDLKDELTSEGRACVGELGSQQCIFYYVVIEEAQLPRSEFEDSLDTEEPVTEDQIVQGTIRQNHQNYGKRGW